MRLFVSRIPLFAVQNNQLLAQLSQKNRKCTLLQFAILALSMISLPALAVGETLQDLIPIAEANNPEIRAAIAQIHGAAGEVITAKTWENPELSVGPGMKRISGSEGEASDRFFRISGEFTQPILFPGKRALQVALAEKNAQANEEALAAIKSQVSFKVLKTFYELLAADEIQKLRTVQVGSAALFAESSKKRADSGYGSDVDAVRGEAELIAARKALAEAAAEVLAARGKLNVLLGRTPASSLVIEGNLEKYKAPLLPRLFDVTCVENNPAYKAQLLHAKKAGIAVEAAKLSKAPDFKVGPFVEHGKDEQVYGVGVSLPIVLWDTKSGAISTAIAEQEKEIAELDRLRLEIGDAINTALSKLKATEQERVLFTHSFLSRLKDSMTKAQKSYETNGTSVLLYLDAKRTFFDTQASYIETLAKVPTAYAELQSALGLPYEHQE